MKKYMITAAAILMIAGMANAQLAAKTTSKATSPKPAMASHTPAHKTATVTAASSTPVASAKQSTGTTIKRKHHHKKGKALQKTVSK